MTIGEYLALTDHKRPGTPLTMMLMLNEIEEHSLKVLPITYLLVKPMLRAIMPTLGGMVKLSGQVGKIHYIGGHK